MQLKVPLGTASVCFFACHTYISSDRDPDVGRHGAATGFNHILGPIKSSPISQRHVSGLTTSSRPLGCSSPTRRGRPHPPTDPVYVTSNETTPADVFCLCIDLGGKPCSTFFATFCRGLSRRSTSGVGVVVSVNMAMVGEGGEEDGGEGTGSGS